jgi:hypothetical protein
MRTKAFRVFPWSVQENAGVSMSSNGTSHAYLRTCVHIVHEHYFISFDANETKTETESVLSNNRRIGRRMCV